MYNKFPPTAQLDIPRQIVIFSLMFFKIIPGKIGDLLGLNLHNILYILKIYQGLPKRITIFKHFGWCTSAGRIKLIYLLAVIK